MLFGVLSKLNNAIVCADIGRAIVGQQVAASARNSGPTWLLSVNAWGTRRPMAASGSKHVFGDVHLDDIISSCGNGVDFAKPSGVYFTDRIHSICQKDTMSMRSRKPPINRLVCGYSMVAMVPRNCDIGPLSTSFKNVHTASHLCFASGAAHDLSFDGSSLHEQPLKSTVALNQTLKLLSGSCYLPHPDKEETGGEDAYFICVEEQAIGVADGVGGWADVGINSGLFSRELMSNSVAAIQEEPEGSIDPARVLEKAHSGTKAKGSSTACIIALTEKGLDAINLGDSGFIVVRDGSTIFQSPVQQHGFNFTYQLESGTTGDLPSSGQVFTISVASGDVVIAGTDGLFDNLYNNEVTAAVVHALKEGLEPQLMAQKIAALARQRAQDRYRQTPFSTAAQGAGFRYYGGKLDDITVVVSYITSSMNV
ncbi:probable protein phosphatase 2C 80 [Tripterygium wilfordii]|uniref:probable protein phosphatase 2C 80 n=1 Tax=Tripterygium wilfordii TaxID=458696 RepID=UPI0018F8601B|nr:probable protein phosphatase 2C 80 [Tripterygium wilfordii]XP_038722691.1 probable protein phosphatase 2C 80 [Tripterygium wilfordii]